MNNPALPEGQVCPAMLPRVCGTPYGASPVVLRIIPEIIPRLWAPSEQLVDSTGQEKEIWRKAKHKEQISSSRRMPESHYVHEGLIR